MLERLSCLAVRTALTVVAVLLVSCRLVSAQSMQMRIPFKSGYGSFIVVEVGINGTGPYEFAIDTGASSSVVDPDLTRALSLPYGNKGNVATVVGLYEVRHANVKHLTLGSITTGPLRVMVQPLGGLKRVNPNIRGILGQDVLRQMDYLIDNRRKEIRVDVNGEILRELTGTRTVMAAVRTRGGAETRDSSVVVGVGNSSLRMLLDSGSASVVFAPHLLGAGVGMPLNLTDQNGEIATASPVHVRLRVGDLVIDCEAAVATSLIRGITVDGLLPTGTFDSLYVCNSSAFVMFEPRRHSFSQSRIWQLGRKRRATTPWVR